jgi:hypothetical protein
VDSRQRSCSGEQLAAMGTIYTTLSVGSIEGGADAGTRLVGDCMKCQQRLAHTPVVPRGQILKRHFNAFTKNLPFVG